MDTESAKPSKPEAGKLQQRWGKKLIDAGWLGLPSVFLLRQQALGLQPLDLNILMQIAVHWWNPDELPFPSKKTLAERIGVTPRTIQRRITQMKADGIMEL